MSKQLRIGVTGVAGASGQSVIKALNMAEFDLEVYAFDVTAYSAGLFMPGVKHSEVLPKPEENIQAWIDAVKAYRLDALIPGADRDLLPLAEHAEAVKALVAPLQFIKRTRDKFKTAMGLASRGFPVPQTSVYVKQVLPPWITYPVVVKPRDDAAMRGFHICYDEEELRFYAARTRNCMVQEYLQGDEYSVNVFSDRDGTPKASLVMKRIMRDGVAYKSEAVDDEELRAFGKRVAYKLGSTGTINVQLMQVNGGQPMIFEINSRCSGSTAIRASLGYNDPEMLIRHFVLGETVQQPVIDYNKFCLRFYDEIYVDRYSIHGMANGEKWN